MNNNGGNKKEITLKERLSKPKEDIEKPEKKTTKKKKKEKKKGEKEGKTEKILTKVNFLKDYKKIDPDDDKGKEKDNIEVKVASKS